MTKYCNIRHSFIQELLKKLQIVCWSLHGKVALLSADPPYSIRHETGKVDNAYDVNINKNLHSRLFCNRLLCAFARMDLCFIPLYNFLTESASCKKRRKGYHPLITKLEMKKIKKTISKLRILMSSFIAFPISKCNIKRNKPGIKSTWPSMPNFFWDSLRGRKWSSRPWTATALLSFQVTACRIQALFVKCPALSLKKPYSFS